MSLIYVVGAVIYRGRSCLVAQRGPGRAFAGFWEFPGGKVELGETAQQALVREISEELGLVIEVGSWLGRGQAAHGSASIVLDVYAATAREFAPVLREHSAIRWCGPEEFDELAWAAADIPLLAPVRAFLASQPQGQGFGSSA